MPDEGEELPPRPPAREPEEAKIQSVTTEPSTWPMYDWLVGNSNVLVKNESSQTITVVMRARKEEITETDTGRDGVDGDLGGDRKRRTQIHAFGPTYHAISGGQEQLFCCFGKSGVVDCVILVKTPTPWYRRRGVSYTSYDRFQIDLYKVAAVVVQDQDLTSDKSTGKVTDINKVLNE